MLRTRNLLCIIMVAAMIIATVLTGCGANSSQENTTPSQSEQQAASSETPTEQQLDPYEINWYIVGGGQPADTAEVEAEINKIIQPEINATLKFHVIGWGDWGTKMGAMIASSEYMDMVFTADWWFYVDNISKGAIIPLNDLMDKYAPDAKAAIGDALLNCASYKNVLYGVPTIKEYAYQGGVILNKKYLDKYSFDINTLTKFEDVEPWLKTIKENETDIIPFAASEQYGPGYFLPFTSATGESGVPGALYDDGRNTTVFNDITSPEYKAQCDIMRKFYLAGYIAKDAGVKDYKIDDQLANGTTFMVCQPLKPGKDKEMSNDKVTWVQKEFSSPVIRTGACMQAISRTSKDPERCMMFLNLLFTNRDLENLLAWGIENKHYTKVSANVINEIPNNGWSLNMQWAFGNQMLSYLKSNEDPQKWESFKKFNEAGVSTPGLGFWPNKEFLQAEYAAIKNVSAQYGGPLTVGAVDPDTTIPKYLNDLKAAGIDTVITEIQKQFDEWKAQK